jgi:Asp-tRNA(Asn)/Glu-tRNA(Gln) amidotransferase C subunit
MMLRLDVARQNLKEAEILNNKARQQRRMFQMPSISVIAD